MEAKYVMFTKRSGSIERRIPVLFFEPVTHVGVYEAMRESEEFAGAKLTSAGFARISLHGVDCYGESTSLKHKGLAHKPQEDDDKVLTYYNMMHGC